MTQRDQNLLLVLPAALVITVFGWFFFRPKFQEWSNAGNDLAAAHAQMLSAEAQANDRVRLADLLAQLDRERKEEATLLQNWHSVAGLFGDHTKRTGRSDQLGDLLQRNSLRLIAEDHGDKDKESRSVMGTPYYLDLFVADPTPPAASATTPEKKPDAVARQTPQLRRYHFTGRYRDVARALDELANGPPIAVPLGLSLKVPEDGQPLEWTFYVCH